MIGYFIATVIGLGIGFGTASLMAGGAYHSGYSDGVRDAQYTQKLRDQGVIDDGR